MQAWTREQFEHKLRDKGRFYHIHHPFHIVMHNGVCSKDEIKGWVAIVFNIKLVIRFRTPAFFATSRDR